MTELVVESGKDHNGATSGSLSTLSRRILLGKGFAGLFSLLLMGATFAPIAENWRPQPKDSFPFSYYPMFSQRRGEIYRVNYMVGLDAQGNRHLISHEFAGNGGFNQTRRQINKLVRQKKAAKLCAAVAANVTMADQPPYSEIVEVQIVRGSFRFAEYFAGNKAPVRERVHASCQIVRDGRTARGES